MMDPRMEELLTGATRQRMDRSAYGDWRSIAGADAVSLAFGFPDHECLPVDGLSAAMESLFAAEGPRSLQYGGGRSATDLSEFVEDRARETDRIDGSYEAVLTNGATHALDAVCRAFLEPGDIVIVEAPTFMGAFGVFWNYGVDIVGAPVDEEGLNVDRLAEGLRSDDFPAPKLVYTIPNFQNPTGTTLSTSRREQLLELAHEFDFVIVEDDAYGELRYDGAGEAALTSLDDEGRSIQLGSFSKTIAPGVRLGWLLVDSSLADTISALAPGGTNVFTRGLVGQYCVSGGFEDNLPVLCQHYERKRNAMLDALTDYMPPSASWTRPDGGFFIWLELSDVDTDALLPAAIDAGVTFLPGSMFYSGVGGENCLRLSYSFASIEEIDRGVQRLGRIVT